MQRKSHGNLTSACIYWTSLTRNSASAFCSSFLRILWTSAAHVSFNSVLKLRAVKSMSPSGRYVLSGTDPNATTYHHIQTPPYYINRNKHDYHSTHGTGQTGRPKILNSTFQQTWTYRSRNAYKCLRRSLTGWGLKICCKWYNSHHLLSVRALFQKHELQHIRM